jgi:hypothetical protein
MTMRTVDVMAGAEPIGQRPFRIADAMVLIAVLFVALAWDRAEGLDALGFLFRLGSMIWPPYSLWNLLFHSAEVALMLVPFLVVGSLSVLALRLQQPRPALRPLLLQPGAVACALATLVIVPAGMIVLSTHFFSGRPLASAWARIVDDVKPEKLTVVAVLIGLSVAVAWIVMRAKGQWRPEASWIDRLGRLVGWGWMLMIVCGMLELVLGLARLASL